MAFPSKNASMILTAAAFLACGGLTEQATQGTDPPSVDGTTEPAHYAVPVKVADDVGIPSAIAIGDERVVFTTKQTMLHGRLGNAGGLFVVHKRLGPALLVSMDPGDARYDALAIDEAHAYVATSDARIFRVPLAGGPETPIAELIPPSRSPSPARTCTSRPTTACSSGYRRTASVRSRRSRRSREGRVR